MSMRLKKIAWAIAHRCIDCQCRLLFTSFERCDYCFRNHIRLVQANIEPLCAKPRELASRILAQQRAKPLLLDDSPQELRSSKYLPITGIEDTPLLRRTEEIYAPNLLSERAGDFSGAGAASSWDSPDRSCSDSSSSSSDSSSSSSSDSSSACSSDSSS